MEKLSNTNLVDLALMFNDKEWFESLSKKLPKKEKVSPDKISSTSLADLALSLNDKEWLKILSEKPQKEKQTLLKHIDELATYFEEAQKAGLFILLIHANDLIMRLNKIDYLIEQAMFLSPEDKKELHNDVLKIEAAFLQYVESLRE